MDKPDIAPQFWNLVDYCKLGMPFIEDVLRSVGHDDLVRFYIESEYAITDIIDRIYPYICDMEINAEDVAAWIIYQGREFYEEVYKTPCIANQINIKDFDWDADLGGLALNIYDQIYNDCIPINDIQRWEF